MRLLLLLLLLLLVHISTRRPSSAEADPCHAHVPLYKDAALSGVPVHVRRLLDRVQEHQRAPP
jgi:hypothetical protein